MWKKDGVLIVNVQLVVQAELEVWRPIVSESSTDIQPNAHVHRVRDRAHLRTGGKRPDFITLKIWQQRYY